MGVSGIIAIISLVFSSFFGISAFAISLTNLILGIKKNEGEKKSADKNSKILERKNEILATDSKNRAEHFKNEERLKEQNNAIWEKTAQKIYEFLEQNSKSMIMEEQKKELITIADEHLSSEQ